jgi:hypothetical protein
VTKQTKGRLAPTVIGDHTYSYASAKQDTIFQTVRIAAVPMKQIMNRVQARDFSDLPEDLAVLAGKVQNKPTVFGSIYLLGQMLKKLFNYVRQCFSNLFSRDDTPNPKAEYELMEYTEGLEELNVWNSLIYLLMAGKRVFQRARKRWAQIYQNLGFFKNLPSRRWRFLESPAGENFMTIVVAVKDCCHHSWIGFSRGSFETFVRSTHRLDHIDRIARIVESFFHSRWHWDRSPSKTAHSGSSAHLARFHSAAISSVVAQHLQHYCSCCAYL